MISPLSSPTTEKKKKKSIFDSKSKNNESSILKSKVDMSIIEHESECTVIFNPNLLQLEIHKNSKGPLRSCDIIDLKHASVINKSLNEIMIKVENKSFVMNMSDEKERRIWMTNLLNSNVNIIDTDNDEIDSIKLSKRKKKLKRNSSKMKHKTIHFISQNQSSTKDNNNIIAPSTSQDSIPQVSYPIYPRLIRISGTRNNVNASIVEPLASKLNKFDCFILDDGIENLYVWRGKSSNMFVKDECNNIAHFIKENHDCKGIRIIQIEQGEEDTLFWSLVGGKDNISDQQDMPLNKPVLFKINLNNENELYEYVKEKSSVTPEDYYGLDNGYEILVVNKIQESIDLDLIKRSIEKYQNDCNILTTKKVRASTFKDKAFVHFFEKIA